MPAYSLGTMSAWAATTHTIQTITGAKTFQADAAASVPLTVRGTSGQTGNLMEWRDSGGVILSRIYSTGSMSMPQAFIGADPGTAGQLRLGITAPGNRGIIVRAAAGQTGNLQEWQDSAGGVLARMNPAGVMSGADAGWTIVGNTGAPAFENGWVHYYSATQEALGFRKLVDGTVKLKGLTKNAAAQAAGSIIYTLPAGYRPAHYMRMACTTHTNTNGGYARVDIGANGAVYYITGNVAELDLSSITFYGEN